MHKLPNIILIVCDTLGAKHMSLYGYHRETTPNLKELVEKEDFAIYTRCFAPAPWTAPSHASLFTGLYPSQHKTVGKQVILDCNLRLLPEMIAPYYQCYALSNNGLIAKFSNYNIGFDKFFECNTHIPYFDLQLLDEKLDKYRGKLSKLLGLLKETKKVNPSTIMKFLWLKLSTRKFSIFEDASLFTIYTFNRLRHILSNEITEIDRPFFIFVNLMQTHGKYNPPRLVRGLFSKKLYRKKFKSLYKKEDIWFDYYLKSKSNCWPDFLNYLSALYDEEILFLDKILFNFLSYIKLQKYWDNTIIIITSDHGELFGEHGHVHHVFTTYNELIYIPLIIKWSKDINIVGTITNIVQLHDIYSTIHDICNLPFPKPISSKSLLDSDKRRIAISQLIDVTYKIEALINRNSKFIPNDDMQPMMSVITNDLKVTKYLDDKIKVFDLNQNMYEDSELDISDKKRFKSLLKTVELIDKMIGFKEISQDVISTR